MEDRLRARQGDTLDQLIARERGLGSDDLARVIAANPGIADHGPVLPTGTLIDVPTPIAPAPRTVNLIQLWDD